MYKHLESLLDTNSEIFDWKPFARHTLSLSLGEKDSPKTSKMSESMASLSLAERRTIYFVRQKFSADLFPAHRCPSIQGF